MKKIHLILTGLSLNIILLSLNRLTKLTSSYLQSFEFLRWLDFNAMLPIPLMAIILYYLLRQQIVYDSPFRKTALFVFLNVLLISGIYFFGAGSGDHEVTNYLHARFCEKQVLNKSLCNIVIFNDDEFSHYVYYLGFVLMNVSLMLLEYNLPRKKSVGTKDLLFIVPNSLFIALGIFANLAFEDIGIDLWVFASVMALAIYLLFFAKRKFAQLPVTFYFGVAYSLGVLSTFVFKYFK
ncbi:hypothetical protein HY612_01070 [Candidatus Roizmanbacteria bacterium]|nr:hypothetical protein [Candidatus Roizmanbacteria bacterium]